MTEIGTTTKNIGIHSLQYNLYAYPEIVFRIEIQCINSLQCYELTRRCSHLFLYMDFTID